MYCWKTSQTIWWNHLRIVLKSFIDAFSTA